PPAGCELPAPPSQWLRRQRGGASTSAGAGGFTSGHCNALSSERSCIREGVSKVVAQRGFMTPRVAQESPQATTDVRHQESAVAQSALSAASLSASSILHREVLYKLQSADPPG